MGGPSLAKTLGGTAIVVALVAVSALLQHVREVEFPAPPATAESLYLTSGTTARRLSVGYSALASDLYWIRAVQYFGNSKRRMNAAVSATAAGNSRATSADYQLLYPLLDITTSLDPRFNIAYRFGAIFLAETPPGGAGRPDLAIALLEKGLKERPDKWEYMQDIGFVNYWWRKDYQAAALWFEKAGRVPGAPWFLRSQAAVTLAEGGNRERSRLLWTSILESAENDWLKADAQRRLQQLDVADLIDGLQKAVDAAMPRTGKLTNWPDLIRAGVVRGVPTDPTGMPLGIDHEARVHLAVKSPLFPLPEEPERDTSHQ